ncbi:hypothetical protein LCGC14_1720620 [marine sediment metagenome]|uniref:Uncharacterized protein n=1 Tax=marine sediment metagenome TaxID=412755 RepID=A0A0F9HCS2_9ZZZZ
MAFLRISIDLAIPTNVANKPVVKAELQELRAFIRKAKKYAVKINEGLANEEMTVIGTYHICHHDEQNTPCEPEVGI